MPSAAAAAVRPQEELYALEEATLFNSLCLLEVQHAEGARLLDFSRAMFRKPNAKGLEFVLHFVYATVKGKIAAKKYFRGVWPLIDKDRQQAKDFYQRAQDWLKEAGQLAAHGQSLVPFQRTPGGPKLVSFLCDLTDWALRAQHERLFPDDAVAHSDMQDTPLLLALAEPLVAAARAQNQLQAQRLLASCQRGSQLQAQAEAAAGKLTELFYDLSAQLGEATAAGPTLPDDALPPSCLDDDGGSDDALLPALQLPPELQAQLAELQQLWASLEQHVDGFGGLAGQVEALAGSDVHPHAIDGQQLRQAGQLPEAPCSAGLDIAAMMEAWLADVAGLCGHVRALAGQPDAAAAAAVAEQQRAWGSTADGHSSSGGACAAPTPLLASSDASSHAPHLYAQLGLHQRCRDQMRSMRSSLSHQMAAAAERIQALESQLFGLMHEEEQRCMAALAAQQQQQQQHQQQHDPDSMQLATAAASAAVGSDAHVQHGRVGAGLFASSGLQLVPPTPLLQQLVQQHTAAERRRQQQTADGGGADASPAAAPVGARLQQLLFMGGSAAQTDTPADACSPGSSRCSRPSRAGSLAQQQGGSLAHAASACSSARSSVSGSVSGASGGVPAAELLMSADLMDLDLVSDDELYCGQHSGASPGLLMGTDSPLAAGLGGGAAGPAGSGLPGFEDLLRVSMLQLPGMGAMAGGAAGEQQAGAPSSSGERQAGGGSSSSRSRSSAGGISFRLAGGGSGDSGTARGGQPRGDDTPPWIGRPAAAAAETQHDAQPGGAGAGADDDAGAAAAADGDNGADAAAAACSPLLVAPVLAAGQPLEPLTGSDYLSSARPRRLTFAAAVCAAGEDSSSASALPAGSPGAGSCSGADDDAGGGDDDGQVAGGAGAGRAPSMLPSLRERFASLMSK